MRSGMVEAKLHSTPVALHLRDGATLFVFVGLAEGFAAGTLSQ
eukprot:CAMPEP_0172710634 /NCGR_PEP_ID=MMETSP1074-20121228/56174_1 /TAXON_ID=2916 /ORGANISM="Ceratium fusus, Strain PA161109" /LENGTH=42 /DNA_ID= /DNA_START= /DNA_END= /DNA_ORIENTATION=